MTGYGFGMLFLNSAHHHAEMAGLYDDTHSFRFQYFVERVANLLAEALLHLQTSREDIHDPRDLAEADHGFVRDVADVDLADDGQQVMLAQRITLDVFYDDHTVRVGREQCAVYYFFQVHFISRGQKPERFVTPARRIAQTFAVRVFADLLDKLFVEFLHGREVSGIGYQVSSMNVRYHFAFKTFLIRRAGGMEFLA